MPSSPDGGAAVGAHLDPAGLVEAVVAKINLHYVFPDRIAKISTAIRGRLAAGAYDAIDQPQALCDAVTADLRAASGDSHFKVFFSAEPQAVTDEPARAPVPWEDQLAELRLHNHRFERVERLAGNVGYLDVRGFVQPDLAGETATAAMTFLARADALIIDLRRNSGGDPDMVVWLASYLVDESIHLYTFRWRGGKEKQGWTLPHVPGSRFGGAKPLYLLTGPETFSGAESFAYELQARKRAVLVGDTTRGGAHFSPGWWVTPHFALSVPNGRPVSPVTGSNWEGTGVAPDVAVSADQAFDRAYELALGRVLERVGASARPPELRLAEEARKALANIGGAAHRAP